MPRNQGRRGAPLLLRQPLRALSDALLPGVRFRQFSALGAAGRPTRTCPPRRVVRLGTSPEQGQCVWPTRTNGNANRTDAAAPPLRLPQGQEMADPRSSLRLTANALA